MAAPAGWYVDPQNPQLMRFFDGQSWTTQTQPVAQAAPEQPSPQSSTPQSSTPQPGWQPQPAQGQSGAGLSYQHPGRQSAGQQPDVGQAGAHGIAQPAQPGFGQPGFQPGAYGQQPGVGQQVPSAGPPATGTPRGVKIALVGAAVGAVAISGIGMALSDDSVEGGLSASDLGLPSSYGCDDLGKEVVSLSAADDAATQVISATDLSEVTNNIGKVTLPEGTDFALVLSCEGEGVWGDGEQTGLELRLSLDSTGELYVEYRGS